jgi:hypothetical protein
MPTLVWIITVVVNTQLLVQTTLHLCTVLTILCTTFSFVKQQHWNYLFHEQHLCLPVTNCCINFSCPITTGGTALAPFSRWQAGSADSAAMLNFGGTSILSLLATMMITFTIKKGIICITDNVISEETYIFSLLPSQFE